MTDVARRDIASMTKSELEALMREMGEPAFRARQIFSWLHKRGAAAFCEMTDLSSALREKLDGEFYITVLAERRRQTAKDGTVKFLFELPDGNVVESVLMRHDYGNSLCVSTQVGCRMGCAFCASTAGGKIRDLFASEILGQLYAAGRLTGLRIDSVVLMGIGEPLDNIQNVLRFLALVRDPDGLGMSHRHISLSTCGLADEIDALANEKLQVTLSVSLHAADDETRNRLMPVNRK
jgi:23S rRNA (adenine2503-C2)-methyltransferase